MPTSARMSPLDWSLLLALSILWGGSFFFVGVAVKALPPFTIVLLRVVIAAARAALVLRATRIADAVGRQDLVRLLRHGTAEQRDPLLAHRWGQTQIASGLASILNATTPLFTVLVAHVADGGRTAVAGAASSACCSASPASSC